MQLMHWNVLRDLQRSSVSRNAIQSLQPDSTTLRLNHHRHALRVERHGPQGLPAWSSAVEHDLQRIGLPPRAPSRILPAIAKVELKDIHGVFGEQMARGRDWELAVLG